MSVQKAFDSFMAEEFKNAVDFFTKASWGASGYSVELFDNGTYRVLWDNHIGNLYDSPGLILSIPFYGNAEQSIRESFQEHWQANQNVQAIIAG